MVIQKQHDLNKIKKAGEIAKGTLKKAVDIVSPGIKTIEIDNFIEENIKSQGGEPAFKGYDTGAGIYPSSCNTPINHQLVHTLPSSDVEVEKGDILTIDIGVKYEGLHVDTAYTIEVGTNEEKDFLNTGKEALSKAISKATVGNTVGDISFEMQNMVENNGYNVSRDLVGHGVGKTLWEPPQIPCFGKKGNGQTLEENLVLAIEIMYMKGDFSLKLGDDGFSLDTKDGSISAQFEHTVIVKADNPLILT